MRAAENIRETTDRIAENPYIKFTARLTMIIVTFIAAPFIYWMTTNMVTSITAMGGILQVQKQQQDQIAIITQTQSRLLDVAAVEAQSRSTQDAAFTVQIQNLKEMAERIDAHLSHTDDRLNALYSNTSKR